MNGRQRSLKDFFLIPNSHSIQSKPWNGRGHTVDGSEIRRENPPDISMKSVVNKGIFFSCQLVITGFLNHQHYLKLTRKFMFNNHIQYSSWTWRMDEHGDFWTTRRHLFQVSKFEWEQVFLPFQILECLRNSKNPGSDFFSPKFHGWSTYPPLDTYPPQK